MKDDVLNSFIDKLLTENIKADEFEQHIDMFSRFLGYTNPDYKYNGTYLSQYVDDFISTSQWLKKKNEKYAEILMKITDLGYFFILLFDQVYYAHLLPKEKDGEKYVESEIHYARINKEKIINKKIEVSVTIIRADKEYTICKEYADFEVDNLAETICDNIKKYINLREEEEI